jgi:hypothetical protein
MSQPILSSGSIMREILASSEVTGIRKKLQQTLTQEQRGDFVKMGDAFERMVSEPGWAYLQAYMMKFIMGGLLTGETNDFTKGFINVLHYVDQIIKTRDMIREKELAEREKE